MKLLKRKLILWIMGIFFLPFVVTVTWFVTFMSFNLLNALQIIPIVIIEGIVVTVWTIMVFTADKYLVNDMFESIFNPSN